ncbi:MAG: hypothetical protein FWE12_01255 [Oscillospiraceae bacterium]|nr:hypothetical protein [Oscillospiraceae bacterium]
MSQLQMNPATRNALANMDLFAFLQSSHVPNKAAAIRLGCFGVLLALGPLTAALFLNLERGSAVMTFAWIIAIVTLIIGLLLLGIALIGLPMAKKRRQGLLRDFALIDKAHGGLKRATNQVLAELKDETTPAYTLESGQYLTKNWLFSLDGMARIINLSDIVCIIGILDKGTYILTTDGSELEIKLGQTTGQETFNLFLAANPHILFNKSEVPLPDGTVVTAEAAYRSKAFPAILAAYTHSKQSAE